MKTTAFLAGALSVLGLLTGCDTIPPGAERGPDGTIAYQVQIEANEPDVRIEANHQYIGNAPLTLKIFGDSDGTFHDFGSYYYIIQAFPTSTNNQYAQTAMFRTGRWFTPEDKIPSKMVFDMHQPTPPPAVAYPVAVPAPYYAPYYYGGPYYYGPPVGVQLYFGGPAYYHHHH